MFAAWTLSTPRPFVIDTRPMASPRFSVLSTATCISLFAQLGAASRVLIGELFAGNCSQRQPNSDLSWIPCVAASGVDQSYGGALFRDLPANMLGCFIMGFLSSTATLKGIFRDLSGEEHSLAAVSPNAAFLQQNSILQVDSEMLAERRCDLPCSWKLQMVQMLLAGKGSYYSSQWLGVGMGLILGTMAGMASLVMGQHAALVLLRRHLSKKETPKPPEDNEHSKSFTLFTSFTLFLLAVSTTAALFGIFRDSELRFWRKFAGAVLLAPFGAVARWQLSCLNGTSPWTWLPVGTLCANLLACIISFVSQGIDTRWASIHSSYQLLLYALRTGLAGSLSTVSTWVVEIQKLMSDVETVSKGYIYVLLSQGMALGLGLVLYGSFLWI